MSRDNLPTISVSDVIDTIDAMRHGEYACGYECDAKQIDAITFFASELTGYSEDEILNMLRGKEEIVQIEIPNLRFKAFVDRKWYDDVCTAVEPIDVIRQALQSKESRIYSESEFCQNMIRTILFHNDRLKAAGLNAYLTINPDPIPNPSFRQYDLYCDGQIFRDALSYPEVGLAVDCILMGSTVNKAEKEAIK